MENPRINYIKQLNSFWDLVYLERPIRTSAVAVYLALLQWNNRLDWKESFTIDYERAMQMVSISKNTYYDCLKELSHNKFIVYSRSDNRSLLGNISITILYQNLVHEQDTTSTPAGLQQDQTCGSSSTLDKQLNKETGKPETPKEINIPFEKFWEIYPKKEAKAKARTAWEKITDKERELVMIDVPIYKATPQFDGYIQMLATTYLNGRRWEDVRSQTSSKKGIQFEQNKLTGFGQKQVGAVDHGR